MGGFGISTQISKRLGQLLPHRQMQHGPVMLTREKPYTEDDGSSISSVGSGSSGSSISIVRRVAGWLPDGMENLIIGRNGRFYTEELEDEKLEVIGGVQYRALRFLSYFVASVGTMSSMVNDQSKLMDSTCCYLSYYLSWLVPSISQSRVTSTHIKRKMASKRLLSIPTGQCST
jgi:hypothetical protein